ncbi:MAG: flavodoxin, partial [Bacteroidota bacterium]|nr:flavodoxin [Bacteroidota bacterium]
MKKFLILTFSLCMVSTMFSCGRVEDSTGKGNNKKPVVTNGNVLIVYFSRAGENYSVGHISVGNTAVMAGYIQDYTGGTAFEIVPVVPYPDGYDKMKEISQQETAGNKRPAIKNP